MLQPGINQVTEQAGRKEQQPRVVEEYAESLHPEQPSNRLVDIGLLLAGLGLLVVGAQLLVGGAVEIPVDVRLVAASKRPLKELVGDGTLREDLYYRLAVVELKLPPLRARRIDIPLLAEHFLERIAAERSQPRKRLSRAALQRLGAHDFPGNVRELEHLLINAGVFASGGTIEAEDLATVKKAVAAIGKAGYYGKSDREGVAIPTEASNEQVEQVTVKGLHLCCGKCVKGLNTALEKCTGVQANTAETKAESFQVSGKFTKADLVKALQEAGFNGVVE